MSYIGMRTAEIALRIPTPDPCACAVVVCRPIRFGKTAPGPAVQIHHTTSIHHTSYVQHTSGNTTRSGSRQHATYDDCPAAPWLARTLHPPTPSDAASGRAEGWAPFEAQSNETASNGGLQTERPPQCRWGLNQRPWIRTARLRWHAVGVGLDRFVSLLRMLPCLGSGLVAGGQ
jgi:hypothetical protein